MPQEPSAFCRNLTCPLPPKTVQVSNWNSLQPWIRSHCCQGKKSYCALCDTQCNIQTGTCSHSRIPRQGVHKGCLVARSAENTQHAEIRWCSDFSTPMSTWMCLWKSCVRTQLEDQDTQDSQRQIIITFCWHKNIQMQPHDIVNRWHRSTLFEI